MDPQMEQTYREGQQAATAHFADETRPFDRVLWGVGRVLGVDHMAVAETWHSPLASVLDTEDLVSVAASMEWELSRWVDGPVHYEVERVQRQQALPNLWDARGLATNIQDQEYLDQLTEEAIRVAWRRQQPGKRVGTNAYKEARDRNWERFQAEEVRGLHRKLVHAVEEAKSRRVTTGDPILAKVSRRAQDLQRRAEDVLALLPDSAKASAALEEAHRLAGVVQGHVEGWEATLAELEQVVGDTAGEGVA